MAMSDYDAIVIGAGMSGLGLSALLAQAGVRVLTVEKGKQIGGRAYSFRYKGHTTNIGGPRAGLEGGKVDAMFERLGVEPGERGFFDDVKTFRNGEFMSLPRLALQGDVAEAGRLMSATRELALSADLAVFDAMKASEWIADHVSSPEVLDVARFAGIVMSTIPRLEDMAASTLFESLRIIQSNPRIYLAAHGYGDFMRILAETGVAQGGEVRTHAGVGEIIIEDGRVAGVVIRAGGRPSERIEAPVVVAALPVWDLFAMADRSLFPDEFVAKVNHLARKTAIFGITAALREPLYDEKFFVLTDGERCGYPISGFMASNVTPTLAPEGEHLFEVCCQCDFELGDDRSRLNAAVDRLTEDLEEMFPGWRDGVIWQQSYFHWEEPARSAERAGVFRPESRAPGRALPGLECAADSAMICAQLILGDYPSLPS
jgi:phytoene dehydrogenase-like protein